MLFQNCALVFSYYIPYLDGIHYCNAFQGNGFSPGFASEDKAQIVS